MKFTGFMAVLALSAGCATAPKEPVTTNFYNIEVQTITGETQELREYKGRVLLIVNTASKCGFTKQYGGLQELQNAYGDKGLLVLGFPSNDFFRQEPGSDREIADFCQTNFGITFPMFAKISVKGKNRHPLYTYLTSKETNPDFFGKISWNFTKFLISPDGRVIGRFGSMTKPSDPILIKAIETAMADAGLLIQPAE